MHSKDDSVFFFWVFFFFLFPSSVVTAEAQSSKQVVLSIPHYIVQLYASALLTISTILSLSLFFFLINFIRTRFCGEEKMKDSFAKSV